MSGAALSVIQSMSTLAARRPKRGDASMCLRPSGVVAMRYRRARRRPIAGRFPGDRSVGSMTWRNTSKCHVPHTQVLMSSRRNVVLEVQASVRGIVRGAPVGGEEFRRRFRALGEACARANRLNPAMIAVKQGQPVDAVDR